MPKAFPSIAEAVHACVTRTLASSRDGLLRIDLPSGLDLDEVVDAVDTEASLRFGLTTPFERRLVSRRKGVAADAKQLTKWRNAAVNERRKSPIIILGRASGRDEAGLRRTRVVIEEAEILRTYRTMGGQWLDAHSSSKNPGRLFRALVDMAQEGFVVASELDTYCRKHFKGSDEAHLHAQGALWELGLLPDPRAMDGVAQGSRLSLNLSTRDLLLDAPDSTADETRLSRLSEAAENNDAVAAAALHFAKSRNRQQLRKITLDGVLKLIGKSSHVGPVDPKPRSHPIDLFEALDRGQPELWEKLEEAAKEWEPSESEFEDSLEVADTTIDLSFAANDPVLEGGVEGGLPLFRTRRPDEQEDQAKLFTIQELSDMAGEVDRLMGKSDALPRVERLLAARDTIAPLARWGDASLELLILRTDLRDAAAEYVTAWLDLADFILQQEDVALSSMLQGRLALMDADWEVRMAPIGEEFTRAILYPIHPFVLLPRLEIARYAHSQRGAKGLGAQIQWAEDRSVPAYPAIWANGKTLIHKGGLSRPEFAVSGAAVRPPVRSGTGLLDVVRSYIGVHPFARRALSILLIDPPAGGGVRSALASLTRHAVVEDLRVFVAVTAEEAIDWSGMGEMFENLGRVTDLEAWTSDLGIGVNLAVVFQAGRVGIAGTHSGEYAPSRGLQNVLTVSVAAPPITAASGSLPERIPFVCLQPRDANDVVLRMMELARSSNREDRFFMVSPMLSTAEASRIACVGDLCDWLVVSTPSPIGLVPPRKLPGRDLVYIGREDLGSYGLFVYARDLFPIRKRLQATLIEAPIAPRVHEVEEQLERLALMVPNGVLRLGRGEGSVTPQIGLIAASHFAQRALRA